MSIRFVESCNLRKTAWSNFLIASLCAREDLHMLQEKKECLQASTHTCRTDRQTDRQTGRDRTDSHRDSERKSEHIIERHCLARSKLYYST